MGIRYHNLLPDSPTPRVFTIAPLPPEKCAYALARYSRSPDSIVDSLEWVRTHDSQKFLESFYFQYGHASIADLGHVVLCFEGISELAATEIEDEPLWDGQARSSRYQDFARSGWITPSTLDPAQRAAYQGAAAQLIEAYTRLHSAITGHLTEQLPCPESMKPDVYRRNIAARAYDVARYLLFFGISTGVGQITSIRSLEKQIRRLQASPYSELRTLAGEIAEACSRPPSCGFPGSTPEPLAPTLARYTEADRYPAATNADLRLWAEQNLPRPTMPEPGLVDLVKPAHAASDIVATLLYPVTQRPFRELYELASSWSQSQRAEVLDIAVRHRSSRDELLRAFRAGSYVFDIVMDMGAYRDLHRHRRCHQFHQEYTTALGYETPAAIEQARLGLEYRAVMDQAIAVHAVLPAPERDYILPFGMRSRFLFKMDFAEAEYICKLRSGVKGHFSYRRIAWEMKQAMHRLEPELGMLINATPPGVEDPLKR